MTSYLIIPDSDIDPESPIDTSLETRYRDNLVAAFEGDAPAPRLQFAAHQQPTAGTAYLLKTIQTAAAWTDSDGYLNAGLHDRYSDKRHLGFSCLLSGVVTVKVEHFTNGIGTADVRLLKNEVEVVEWSTNSQARTRRSYDLPVSAGDLIILQNRRGGGSGESWWQNLQVYSGTQSIAVS
jgi:hypothetical protein